MVPTIATKLPMVAFLAGILNNRPLATIFATRFMVLRTASGGKQS